MFKNKFLRLVLAILAIVSITACSSTKADVKVKETNSITKESVTKETVPETEPETEPFVPKTVNIRMIGDMLLHDAVSNSGKMVDGSYNYDHFFANVKADIEKADLAIVNQEVILGGIELGISGYPCFNAVYEVGDAIVKAGFDAVLHATNHTIDKGAKGVDNCIDFWRNKYPQMAVLGINKTLEDRNNIYVYEKDGIKIAVLNYTYGTNGIALPEGREYIVNLLDEEKVKADIIKAEEIADFTVVCPHWGSEYTHQETDEQKYWAQIFADNGVDLVIGAHPHVIEPVKWVTGALGNQMLVYYSLGNFISAQDKAPRMLGAMADVTIEKNEAGDTYIKEFGVIPLVTHRIFGTGATTTYKLSDYTEDLASKNTIKASDPTFSIQMMKDLCKQVFGDLYKE